MTVLLLCIGGRADRATAQSPSPAASCDRRFVDARTLKAARPIPPPLAVAHHIGGEVVVQITLDENSKIVAASIVRSPSALLNQAAVEAARGSTFATRIQNCVPVGGTYNFIVEFDDPNLAHPMPPVTMVTYFSGAWNCATADGSPSFRLFGINPSQRSLIETHTFRNATGEVLTTTVAYVQAGNELHATRGEAPDPFPGISTGWSGDRLTFRFAPGPPVVPESVTYERTKPDAFVRTEIVGPPGETSVEQCERIAPVVAH
jgi:TonB family protein